MVEVVAAIEIERDMRRRSADPLAYQDIQLRRAEERAVRAVVGDDPEGLDAPAQNDDRGKDRQRIATAKAATARPA